MADETKHSFDFDFVDEPITIDDFIQPLLELCDCIVEIELSYVTATCSRGCSACCRQLIPLGAAEAIHLDRVVASLPKEKQRKIRKRIGHIVQTLGKPSAKDKKQDSVEFAQRYFRMGIPCPFLEDDACGIYEQRPFVCREYNVSSPPSRCANLYNEDPERVAYGLNFGGLVMVFCAKLFGLPQMPVPLFRFAQWSKAYQNLKDKTFPSAWLFERFFDGLARGEYKNSIVRTIRWSYAETEQPESLFELLADRNTARDRERRERLLEQGAVIENGPSLEPAQLPKLLIREANAENIRQVCAYLVENNLLKLEQEVSLEVGAGDGYLKYLISLSQDSTLRQLGARLVETEHSARVVARNAEQGKRTIQLGLADLSEHFGENFTPLVVSLNVLDVFPEDELTRHIESIRRVLKKDGIVVHLMSSAIHPAVFQDIATAYPDRLYLPYQENGHIGTRMVATRSPVRDFYPSADEPEHLARLFQQAPDQYMQVAANMDRWFETNAEDTTCVLLHRFSLGKIVTSLRTCGFEIVRHDQVHASKRVTRTEHHDKIQEADTFHNLLGALITSKEEPGQNPWVREKSTFGVVIAKR